MKKIALYIVLLAYCTVIIKPVTPYISDTIAHIFSYNQHMATVHYENGKLHVHGEVIDNAKKTDSEKESPALKKENKANDHITVQYQQLVKTTPLVTIYPIPSITSLPYILKSGDYPPPRA